MSTILCHATQQSRGTRVSLLCYEEATVCCASLSVLVIKRSTISRASGQGETSACTNVKCKYSALRHFMPFHTILPRPQSTASESVYTLSLMWLFNLNFLLLSNFFNDQHSSEYSRFFVYFCLHQHLITHVFALSLVSSSMGVQIFKKKKTWSQLFYAMPHNNSAERGPHCFVMTKLQFVVLY